MCLPMCLHRRRVLFAHSRWWQQLVHALEHDLPRQYEKPQDLSVFADSIEFQDPVTTLSGKLQYRGMLCE